MLVHVQQPPLETTLRSETKKVEHLLARGVKRDAPFGPLNWTPLYEAVLKNDIYTMELILNRCRSQQKRWRQSDASSRSYIEEQNICYTVIII